MDRVSKIRFGIVLVISVPEIVKISIVAKARLQNQLPLVILFGNHVCDICDVQHKLIFCSYLFHCLLHNLLQLYTRFICIKRNFFSHTLYIVLQ